MVEFNEEEREYLLALLKSAHTRLLHELHHARRLDFKTQLKREIELNEEVMARVEYVLHAVR